MKHFFTLLSFNLVVSIFYAIIQGFSSFSFINSFFIIGMIYFLFGCLCFVWERGFFNLTTYSFNKVLHQIHKSRIIIEDSPERWKNSKFLNQRKISIDKRGSVGERFFARELCSDVISGG